MTNKTRPPQCPETALAPHHLSSSVRYREEAAEGDSSEDGTFHAVYVAAAARGLRAAAEGDRTSCQQPSCPLQPDQLLQQLRAAEESDAR